MINGILVNILRFYSFIMLFLVVIILAGIFLSLKFRHFKFNVKKIKFYTLFLNLDNASILSFAAAIMRYSFLIWYLVILPDFHVSYVIFLLVLSLLFNIEVGKYFSFIFDFLNLIIQYVSLVLLGFLKGYLFDVKFVWYVIAMVILLSTFIFIYITYFFFKNIKDILTKE